MGNEVVRAASGIKIEVAHQLAEGAAVHGRLVHEVDDLVVRIVSLRVAEAGEFVNDAVGCHQIL